MKSSLTMLERAVLLACVSLFIAGAAQAALLDCDPDGTGEVDAFYDTDLNITWLRNVSPGRVGNWRQQMTRAAGFSIGGHSDWRLPTSEDWVMSQEVV